MYTCCPYCKSEPSGPTEARTLVRSGRFFRKSDGRWIQRLRCLKCKKVLSHATFNPCYLQNKRQLNHSLKMLLVSGVSQRRAAKILNISRTTVVRKFCFLGLRANTELFEWNQSKPKASIVEFDDLETFEHTKCKPLSVTLMVEHSTRRILGFRVSRMPAKGLLAAISRKKYGPRPDERRLARDQLFAHVKDFVDPKARIKSDENPHYPKSVKKHFPQSTHEVFKGRKGAITGQGELKKIGFDPLFSLNHSCAMLRANINRLFRKTWCTTKKPERLAAHIALYATYHNEMLKS